MPANTRVSGTYKDLAAISVKVAGTWKEVDTGSVKVSGVWKEFFSAVSAISVEYYVLGGGGSGAGFQPGVTWGEGGSGGFRQTATDDFELGVSYTVTVGAGASGVGNSTSGNDGSNSVFATVTASGGPKGVTGPSTGGEGLGNVNGPVGASNTFGGVGETYNSVNYGGGGTWGNAQPPAPSPSGNDFGGGWAYESGGIQITAPANRGGGGHGARVNGATSGNGGSGIVILKYPDTFTISVGAGLTANTPAAAGGFKTTTFTAGSGTVSFS